MLDRFRRVRRVLRVDYVVLRLGPQGHVVRQGLQRSLPSGLAKARVQNQAEASRNRVRLLVL